jgi:hypothetical protein
LQGRFGESAALCERVLRAKPWHFGARSGIVMSYSKLGSDDLVMRHAPSLLPPPGLVEVMASDGG